MSTLNQEETRSLRAIRDFIEKGMNGRRFKPGTISSHCFVCETGAMNKSPDGITCGDASCREDLPGKILEMARKCKELEEEIDKAREHLESLDDENAKFKEKAKDFSQEVESLTLRYEKLRENAGKACEAISALIPPGVDTEESSPFRILVDIEIDLERNL